MCADSHEMPPFDDFGWLGGQIGGTGRGSLPTSPNNLAANDCRDLQTLPTSPVSLNLVEDDEKHTTYLQLQRVLEYHPPLPTTLKIQYGCLAASLVWRLKKVGWLQSARHAESWLPLHSPDTHCNIYTTRHMHRLDFPSNLI